MHIRIKSIKESFDFVVGLREEEKLLFVHVFDFLFDGAEVVVVLELLIAEDEVDITNDADLSVCSEVFELELWDGVVLDIDMLWIVYETLVDFQVVGLAFKISLVGVLNELF